MYLWHGTNVRSALSIAQNDFRIDLAGSSTGTMYGLGAYFAEHCTKADEYASDEPGGYYDEVYALLLCRVCLGKFYYTKVRDTEAGSHVRSGSFDSTVGDRLTSADTFREFVLYNSDAIYPEYVVLYTRVFASDPPSKVARLTADLYHLQLPVYWANCHKDPAREPFHDQFLVAQYTVLLLQELATACFKGKTGTVEIVRAKRVENSVTWQKYVAYKKKLQQQMQGLAVDRPERPFLTARDLDSTHGGEILTFSFLNSRDSTEECVSITNLEEPLNEHLLWHGTSKEAAEKIAESDFKIPVGKDMKHAARFGNGAYLAEDLEKSLTYAEPTSDGNRVVLLCRTLCGDFYYTESHTEINAAQKREAQSKHSVLANPLGQGPREFIVPSSDQVYPEFILELKVTDWEPPPPAPTASKSKAMVRGLQGLGFRV
ncbi:Tnks [Symbiodinium natans]|uniref:Poly [ADP-ribose] polymerase n=1 Tax=Symbiodinium natans TaxID=878477 RepID=A0A812JS60_9DINO|nr:Tnks [Symbiodinium natans]